MGEKASEKAVVPRVILKKTWQEPEGACLRSGACPPRLQRRGVTRATDQLHSAPEGLA